MKYQQRTFLVLFSFSGCITYVLWQKNALPNLSPRVVDDFHVWQEWTQSGWHFQWRGRAGDTIAFEIELPSLFTFRILSTKCFIKGLSRSEGILERGTAEKAEAGTEKREERGELSIQPSIHSTVDELVMGTRDLCLAQSSPKRSYWVLNSCLLKMVCMIWATEHLQIWTNERFLRVCDAHLLGKL